MPPTLLVGDHVFVNACSARDDRHRAVFPLREPKRGEVIVFQFARAERHDLSRRTSGRTCRATRS